MMTNQNQNQMNQPVQSNPDSVFETAEEFARVTSWDPPLPNLWEEYEQQSRFATLVHGAIHNGGAPAFGDTGLEKLYG